MILADVSTLHSEQTPYRAQKYVKYNKVISSLDLGLEHWVRHRLPEKYNLCPPT